MVASINTTIQLISDLGFTQNEYKVYKGFLTHPDKTPAQMSRILSMDKSSTYRAVADLEKTGLLVSSPRNKGTTYRAADPEILKNLHLERISRLKSQEKQLFSLIETLKEHKHSRAVQTRVEYGLAAVQKIMTESQKSKEKLIRERFRHHSFFSNKNHVQFVVDYARKRVQNGIKILQLEYDLEEMEDVFSNIMSDQKSFNKEVRLLPRSLNDMNSLRIWDNTTNIVSESDEGEIIVMTIRDRLITDMMKNIYNFIWESSEKYTPPKSGSN